MSDFPEYRARLEVVRLFKRLFGMLDSRKYRVVSGPVDWSIWPFGDHPWGAAIISAEFPIVGPADSAVRLMSLSLELVTRVAAPPAGEDVDPVDEETVEMLARDAEQVMLTALSTQSETTGESGDPIVLNLTEATARIIVSTDLQIVGLDVDVSIEY